MTPIEPIQPVPHKHKGPADRPCETCGLAKGHTVHLADDPAPDPPPEGGGDTPPK